MEAFGVASVPDAWHRLLKAAGDLAHGIVGRWRQRTVEGVRATRATAFSPTRRAVRERFAWRWSFPLLHGRGSSGQGRGRRFGQKEWLPRPAPGTRGRQQMQGSHIRVSEDRTRAAKRVAAVRFGEFYSICAWCVIQNWELDASFKDRIETAGWIIGCCWGSAPIGRIVADKCEPTEPPGSDIHDPRVRDAAMVRGGALSMGEDDRSSAGWVG